MSKSPVSRLANSYLNNALTTITNPELKVSKKIPTSGYVIGLYADLISKVKK